MLLIEIYKSLLLSSGKARTSYKLGCKSQADRFWAHDTMYADNGKVILLQNFEIICFYRWEY